MKRIKKAVTDIFLIVLVSTFFVSCASLDKQKQTREPLQKDPAISQKVKPQHRHVTKEAEDKSPEHKIETQSPSPLTTTPQTPVETNPQQKYYNMGMRYYAQEKYNEAKKAWQRVIKLGKRTDLADKARENIKKVDQILKTLKEMSGQ